MDDTRTWPTARNKTDLAGQFEELYKELNEWKAKALWLHGKYLNEEAKVADQMDRAEAAETRARELEAKLARIPNLIRFSLARGGNGYHMRSTRNGSWIDRDQLIAVINGTPDPWDEAPTGVDND